MRCRDVPGGVQWLRICPATRGIQIPSLVGELRSHEPRSNEAHARQLESLGATAQDPAGPNQDHTQPNIFFKDITKNSNTLATWCEELTHLKRPWWWERLKAGGEGDDRGWDGWMALPIQWTWVWTNSGSWWWTGMPGMLQSMGSQRVGHDWATELKNYKGKSLSGRKFITSIRQRVLSTLYKELKLNNKANIPIKVDKILANTSKQTFKCPISM